MSEMFNMLFFGVYGFFRKEKGAMCDDPADRC